MDYLIGDPVVTPMSEQVQYSEKLALLSPCFVVNDGASLECNEGFTRSELGIPQEAMVYCCFNQPYKIDPIMFEVWMQILRQVTGSVFWTAAFNPLAVENLRLKAEARNVSHSRLIFSEKAPLERHLKRLEVADLSLDTRIYNGGSTTGNALWAGVPVLTLEGGSYVSKMTASMLYAVGFGELVTRNLDEYRTTAISLGEDRTRLRRLSAKLRRDRISGRFFDTQRFVRNIEKAYQEMWERYLKGKKPRQFEVCDG